MANTILPPLTGKDGYIALLNGPSNPLSSTSGLGAITVGTPGTGYTVPPTISFTGGGGGSGATAHATVAAGAITAIILDSPGSGYTTAPTVVITPVVGGTGGAATVVLGVIEATTNVLQLPGGSLFFPANQAFSVTNRLHKVLDPLVPLLVYNNGILVPTTQYKVLYGAGVILFRAPLTGTPVITLAGNYRQTVTGNDVVGMSHVSNWQLNLTATQVPGDEYGTDMVPEYRGKFGGTWQFDRLSSSTGLDLFYLMMLQSFFIFALYEELQSNRFWILMGDLSASPQNAPTAAMATGVVTGTIKYLPSFLNEPL